jgi:CHASE3 domain sensor protein
MKHGCDDDRRSAGIRRWLRRVAAGLLAGLVIGCAPIVRAQDDPPLPIDPTPLADLLTTQEKMQLTDAHNPKKTIETYIKIADAHIDAALAAVRSNDARHAEHELDVFQKAMAECVKLAESLTEGKRSTAKKVEQSLYKDLRTLESVERLFPVERVQFAEAAIKRTKRFRVQMLNIAIASGEVLKDPDADKPPKTENRDDATPSRPPLLELRGALLDQAAWRTSFSSRNVGKETASLRRWGGQIAGDYLTEEEDDHVREAQAADDRIKVFMKIADRRLAALNPAPAPTEPKAIKKAEEEKKEWGELPKLSRAELLLHYARAIEEGMAKLEDAYEHNPKSKTLGKALDILREATDRHLQTLRALTAAGKDERESDALRRAIEQAEVANDGARKGMKAKST